MARAPQKRKRQEPVAGLVGLRSAVADSVDVFLALRDVLRLRECARALTKQYHPEQRPALWRRVRPNVNEFHRNLLTPAGARLFESVYAGHSRRGYRKMVGEVACRTGNATLVRWIWNGPNEWHSGKVERHFCILCEHGYTELAQWLAAKTSFTLDIGGIHSLVWRASCAGDVRTAEWLIAYGWPLAARERGCTLLLNACEHDHLGFAAWVLRRFPLDLSSEHVCGVALVACGVGAPRAVRFLLEAFDLSWEDVRADYLRIMEALDLLAIEGDAAAQGTREWLMQRFHESWQAEANDRP